MTKEQSSQNNMNQEIYTTTEYPNLGIVSDNTNIFFGLGVFCLCYSLLIILYFRIKGDPLWKKTSK